MKIVLILFVVAAVAALPTPDEWEDFKTKFNKHYADEAEEKMRKEIFYQNLKLIVDQNQKYSHGSVDWTVAVNKYADRTQEELLDISNRYLQDL